MKRPRASIASMMAVVLFAALAVAALARPTEVWASLLHFLALSLLCLAILGTAFQAGAKRRFWAGFALFGLVNYLSYLAFSFSWSLLPALPVEPLAEYLLEVMHPLYLRRNDTPSGFVQFYRIIYCLWVVSTGFLGGIAARYFFTGDSINAVPLENEGGPMPRREE